MKTKDLLEAVQAGKLVAVVVWWAGEARVMRWNDRETKQKREMRLVEHSVLVDAGTIKVTERLPDDADVSKIKVPFKRMQKVVLHIESITVEKGSTRASGTLEPLEE